MDKLKASKEKITLQLEIDLYERTQVNGEKLFFTYMVIVNNKWQKGHRRFTKFKMQDQACKKRYKNSMFNNKRLRKKEILCEVSYLHSVVESLLGET